MNTSTIWEGLVLLAICATIVWVSILVRCLWVVVHDWRERRRWRCTDLVWPVAPKEHRRDSDLVWPVEVPLATANLQQATFKPKRGEAAPAEPQ